MSSFIQLHLLTSYPPSNLNRDDLGRPKTAIMGGVNRLRISSQSHKRSWRTSDIFEEALKGHIGKRTKEMGIKVYKALIEKGVEEKKATEWARAIAGVFGASKKENKKEPLEGLEIEQLAHFSPIEEKAIFDLVDKLAESDSTPTDDDLKLLREKHKAADIAMFGRMLASAPKYNTEAAVQVAHAITVHKVAVEDDFFTAVDDLNEGEEDMGAGHMGETEFAAGVFYLYICIDCGLLVDNLSSDKELAKNTLAALVECAAKIAPTGKQNSFASRAFTSYILAEKGGNQPRSLSVSYLKPVNGADVMAGAITALEETMENMDKVYGKCADDRKVMNAHDVKGSLDEIIAFVKECVDNA